MYFLISFVNSLSLVGQGKFTLTLTTLCNLFSLARSETTGSGRHASTSHFQPPQSTMSKSGHFPTCGAIYWQKGGTLLGQRLWRWPNSTQTYENNRKSFEFSHLEMKWNESGFRPPLCTYRLNCARRTSWGWWDDWDDTVLQTQDSKLEPWRSEAEHATSRSRRLPTILTFTRGWGRNNFVSFKPPRPGTKPRTLAWKAAVLTTTLGPPPLTFRRCCNVWSENTSRNSMSTDQKKQETNVI